MPKVRRPPLHHLSHRRQSSDFSLSLPHPHSPSGRQPPPGSQEAYGGVRLEAMPGGGRIVNDPAAAAAAGAGGRRTHGSRVRLLFCKLFVLRNADFEDSTLPPALPPSLLPQVANPPTRPQTVVQKTKMVRNTCHVRKDTVRLLPPSFQPLEQEGGSTSSSTTSVGRYHLSFRFDADVPCKVAVYWAATEGKDEAGRLW